MIAVIGNMISRTTSVGLFLGIVYLICSTGIFRLVIKGRYIRLYSILGGMLIVFTMLSVYLYNNDPFSTRISDLPLKLSLTGWKREN